VSTRVLLLFEPPTAAGLRSSWIVVWTIVGVVDDFLAYGLTWLLLLVLVVVAAFLAYGLLLTAAAAYGFFATITAGAGGGAGLRFAASDLTVVAVVVVLSFPFGCAFCCFLQRALSNCSSP